MVKILRLNARNPWNLWDILNSASLRCRTGIPELMIPRPRNAKNAMMMSRTLPMVLEANKVRIHARREDETWIQARSQRSRERWAIHNPCSQQPTPQDMDREGLFDKIETTRKRPGHTKSKSHTAAAGENASKCELQQRFATEAGPFFADSRTSRRRRRQEFVVGDSSKKQQRMLPRWELETGDPCCSCLVELDYHCAGNAEKGQPRDLAAMRARRYHLSNTRQATPLIIFKTPLRSNTFLSLSILLHPTDHI